MQQPLVSNLLAVHDDVERTDIPFVSPIKEHYAIVAVGTYSHVETDAVHSLSVDPRASARLTRLAVALIIVSGFLVAHRQEEVLHMSADSHLACTDGAHAIQSAHNVAGQRLHPERHTSLPLGEIERNGMMHLIIPVRHEVVHMVVRELLAVGVNVKLTVSSVASPVPEHQFAGMVRVDLHRIGNPSVKRVAPSQTVVTAHALALHVVGTLRLLVAHHHLVDIYLLVGYSLSG